VYFVGGSFRAHVAARHVAWTISYATAIFFKISHIVSFLAEQNVVLSSPLLHLASNTKTITKNCGLRFAAKEESALNFSYFSCFLFLI
jgi:hypothetical protein